MVLVFWGIFTVAEIVVGCFEKMGVWSMWGMAEEVNRYRKRGGGEKGGWWDER